MTDLGNGLFAIKANSKLKMDGLFKINKQNFFVYASVFLDAGIRLDFNDFDFNHTYKILGTVTNLKIDFNYRAKTGLGTFDFYELLSSKGLHFENPCGKEPNPLDYLTDAFETDLKNWQQAQNNLIEKLVIIKKV